MANASDTSPYILAAPDATLPNSRKLAASGGIITQDTGGEGTYTINTVGNLNQLNGFSSPGIITYNTGSSLFEAVNLNAGTGIAITNPDGQGGNPVISVVPNTTTQQVNILNNGLLSTQPRENLNFIPGGSVSITVGDDSMLNRSDITISATPGASLASTYILKTPDVNLPNAEPLSPLATGILKVTTGTGTLSTAVPNTDYQAASVNLTSISGLTPDIGSLIVGSGTAYEEFPTSSVPGEVLTSNGIGSLPSWQPPAIGDLVVVLPDNSTPQVLAPRTTFICTNTTGVGNRKSFILPDFPNPGDFYQIIGYGNAGWSIDLAGQNVTVGTLMSTISISSILGTDSIIIYCINSTDCVAQIPSGQLNVL